MPVLAPDLVVLAAGIGSRFGGVKQVQPVGPGGELIIEYSVFDALRAGFGRVVFVIRRDIEADFRAAIGRRLESRVEVKYVFQDLDAEARALPVRTKPWGTGHAVLAARGVINGPFAAINADDFYGAAAFTALTNHFRAPAGGAGQCAMVGYPLSDTLSDHGTVSRGVCATDARGRLERIVEITRIEKTAAGPQYRDGAGQVQALAPATMVSMNFWGLVPAVFPKLEEQFASFLLRSGADASAEFFLPTALDALIARGALEVAVLPASGNWFGLTYREDIVAARSAIARLTAEGAYPSPLWG